MNRRKIGLYAGLMLAMLFWAFSFIWYKQAYISLNPMALVFFRMIIAFVFVSILLIISRSLQRIQKKDYKLFALLVIFDPFLYFISESYGMKLVSPSLGSIIISFIPLLTPVLAYYLFRERLTWLNFAGITISFAGVLFVLIGPDFTLMAPIAGVSLMFLAVFCAIGYSAVIVYLAKKYRPLTIIWVQSLFGALAFLPLFLIFDLHETLDIKWTWEIISPVIKLGVFPSVLSFAFYNYAIREIGITRANVFTNFIPILTAILSFFILSEEMPAGKIIGIALVIAGLLVSQKR
jgi:drug/metabolite transporter (DMT)-like permease